jgi:hypothetical protein
LLEDAIDALDRLLRTALIHYSTDSDVTNRPEDDVYTALQILVAAIWQWQDPADCVTLFDISGKRELKSLLQLQVQKIADRITNDNARMD